MVSLDIDDATLNLLKLVSGLKPGDLIVLCRQGRPEIEIRHSPHQVREQPKGGVSEGTLEVPDSFLDPLPDEIVDAFYNAPVLSPTDADSDLESQDGPVLPYGDSVSQD